MTDPTNSSDAKAKRNINWANILTVTSAAVLIGAELFGAVFAGGWALAGFLRLDYYLGDYGTYLLQGIFCGGGIYVMVLFFRTALRVEPFITRE